VARLYPDAKPTIGPPIENGFYYDFADLHISDEDFERIEKEMQAICKANYSSHREVLSGKDEALHKFKKNKYKLELIEELAEDVEITGYRQGEFFDLCRGPHLPTVGKIKAIKLMKTSGAYWRGDSNREMLTRIYGITFPDRKLLKEYLDRLEEAKKRDHKVLGPQLDLYSIHEQAPGMPFFHPKGLHIFNKLIEHMRKLHKEAGYIEIKTPQIMTQDLWETSGHWEHYHANMFTSYIEDRHYAIKPMNCPGGILYYKSHQHSYRQLPHRVAEFGHVHRYEPHGALSGLFRVRGFHQDDAHIYCTPEQLQGEILDILQLADRLYSSFGLQYHLELSTRPEEGTIGTDDDWDLATTALERALREWGREFRINEGDGAFYGPKIDIHIKDALGRTWQCGTVQVDMALPERFQLEYTADDGTRRRPIMVHRALYGSLERFIGSLIEFYAGKFPLWLNPRQIRILTVADRHIEYARDLAKKFHAEQFECEVDDSGESVNKKVRNAQLDKVSYILIVGDQEVEKGTASLRTREEVEIDPFIVRLKSEVASRALGLT
jgi:threonyl-tRNA synthetase